MADKLNKIASSGVTKSAAKTGAGAVPGGGIVSNVLNASEYVTDPKKRKKTLWGCLAGIGCCALPFFIGLAVGIAIVASLCEKYQTYKMWEPKIIAGITIVKPELGIGLWAGGKLADVLGTEAGQKAYNSLPQAIRDQMPLSLVMQFSNGKAFFDKTCGSTLNYGGNGLPCGTFAEIVEKYVGKGAAEMRTLMTGAGFQFDPGLWCADSVAFFVSQMGYYTKDFHYPHTNGWISRFRSGRDGWRLLSEGETPQPGDVAMAKDGHHTCMVYQVIDANHFYCFGGNQGDGRVTKDSYRITKQWYFGRLPGR